MKSQQNFDSAVLRSRLDLRRRSNCVFVDSDEFCRLAISNRELTRLDFPHAEIKGLAEQETGMQFLIENEKLIGIGV